MPVPNMKDWEHAINQETREELDMLMEKWGWKREIETISIDFSPRSGPILNLYRCRGDRVSCSCEGKSSLIYLIRMPTSVIFSCQYCRKNTSPISFEAFDKISSRRITVNEAFEISDRENIMVPSGLELAYPDRRRLKGKPRFVI